MGPLRVRGEVSSARASIGLFLSLSHGCMLKWAPCASFVPSEATCSLQLPPHHHHHHSPPAMGDEEGQGSRGGGLVPIDGTADLQNHRNRRAPQVEPLHLERLPRKLHSANASAASSPSTT